LLKKTVCEYMNRRNKEFAEEVKALLLTILDALDWSYERDVDLNFILEKHMTERMIATRDCALRHFDNLKSRDLFVFIRDVNGVHIKLNPKYADAKVDLLIWSIQMPKLQN
jgi:hypothetical protein